MESIEKLRDCTWIGGDKVNEYLDEIEREIAERYMELPVDADGVPIEMWDRVEPDGYQGGKVASIEIRGNGTAWVGVLPDGWDTPTVYRADCVHHIKPDPVKELLEEFALDIRMERFEKAELTKQTIEQYAARIRSWCERRDVDE